MIKYIRFSILLIILSVYMYGCGPVPRPPEPDNLYWPLPPDPPRVKYLRSIYSEDDIGRVYSLKERLFGKDYFDQLARPYGVYARYGKIAVADIVLKRVLLFDLDEKKLIAIGEEGGMNTPSSAVFDREGTVYVADGRAGKVIVYDNSGRYRTAFSFKDGRPVAVALDEQLSRLYVADAAGHRVVAFSLDGKRLFEFGGHGKEEGRLHLPLDITVDRQGMIYVLDVRNFRVQIFDSTGRYVSSFGSVGDSPGFFANPKGIGTDSEGHIYVTDAAFSNFQIFDRSGSPLMFIGGLGPRPGEMHLPAGISIDENDRIYVADQLNARIQVFQYIRQ